MREKILQFVEKLKHVGLGSSDRFCSMSTVGIYHRCRTPGCHGGWAAIALGIKEDHYIYGAQALAQFLGFLDEEALRQWASDNPGIWGNEHGYYMFHKPFAFDQERDTFSVTVLIDWWEGVANRLK